MFNNDPSVETSLPTLTCDVCVVGVGFGAALAAARRGAIVIAIERNQVIGGTCTMSRVQIWEPVSGAEGIPRELWERMSQLPLGTDGKPYDVGQPGWFQVEEPKNWRQFRSLAFEPWAWDWCAQEMLVESGNCTLLLETSFVDVDASGGRVRAIKAQQRGQPLVIRAKQFIDSTADGHLCAAAGCEWHLGQDPRSLYGESLAPEDASPRLNPMSLLYRIHDTRVKQRPWLPPDTPPDYCTRGASLRLLPNGDVSVNRCGMLAGNPLDRRRWPALLREALRRVYAHFYWMQTEFGFETWVMCGVAPEIGVRESRRIMGEYMLVEQDIRAGTRGQDHPDIVTTADHTLDMHGRGGYNVPPPNGPYGIPFRCLLPKGYSNLLIASRAASFSHIAASSCRLSRTIMKLGEAAGTAAAMAVADSAPLRQIDTEALKGELAQQTKGTSGRA